MIPDSRVVMIENAGHLPMEETPEQTAAAIEEFISQRLPQTSAAPL